MHFHLPKPVHGWRGFFGEVGIIVVGVLIALGAEQLVERWRHHEQVKLARDAVREELLNAAVYGYERLAIQPCLQSRIAQLANALGEPAGPWSGSQMPYKSVELGWTNVMPVPYRAPSRNFPTDAWQTAIASGTVNHMSPSQAQQLAGIYAQIRDFDASQREEAQAAASLGPLGFNRMLDDASRTRMLSALAEVDRINSLMAVVAKQVILAVRAEKLGFPRTKVEKLRNDIVGDQRDTRGNCVRTDLPLDLG
jgi:hypothetical protein